MATWQLLALAKGKSCTFTFCQAKKEKQLEPGELCWDEIPSAPKGATARKWWRSWLPVSRVPQRSPGQGRAAESAQEELRSRARLQGQVWTPLWVVMHRHQQEQQGLQGLPSFTCTQSHSKCYQVWLAGSSGRLGTDHHPPSLTPLQAALPSLHGLQQVRHILGIWTLLQGREPKHPAGASSEPGCRDGTDYPNSIHHLPMTNVQREVACPQN